MKRLIVFGLLFISIISFAQQRNKSFDAFWPSFRAAVIAYNVQALDSLVAYPLIVRGTMDYDPVKKINRDKIISTLKTALAQDGAMDDERFEGETNMQEIKRKVTIPNKGYKFSHPDDIYMTVANLDFKKISGKWKLETIYIDMTK